MLASVAQQPSDLDIFRVRRDDSDDITLASGFARMLEERVQVESRRAKKKKKQQEKKKVEWTTDGDPRATEKEEKKVEWTMDNDLADDKNM